MSTFRPDTSGLSFRFACSVVLLGGRGAADKCHWRVWGALAVSRPHWVCPPLTVCVLPRLHGSGSRLLSRERALSCMHFPGLSRSGSSFRVLHKSPDSVGPAFCAFPGPSSSGIQELDERALPGCSAPHPLRGPSLSFCAPPGRLRLVSLLGSWTLAATLSADVNHPESQGVFG